MYVYLKYTSIMHHAHRLLMVMMCSFILFWAEWLPGNIFWCNWINTWTHFAWEFLLICWNMCFFSSLKAESFGTWTYRKIKYGKILLVTVSITDWRIVSIPLDRPSAACLWASSHLEFRCSCCRENNASEFYLWWNWGNVFQPNKILFDLHLLLGPECFN